MAFAADIRTKVSEAVTAQEAGDYDTALAKLRSARMLLAGLPKRSKHGENEMEFDVAQLDQMIKDLQSQATAAAGIKLTKITFAQATE